MNLSLLKVCAFSRQYIDNRNSVEDLVQDFDPVPGEGFRRSINLYDGNRDNSGYPVELYYPK